MSTITAKVVKASFIAKDGTQRNGYKIGNDGAWVSSNLDEAEFIKALNEYGLAPAPGGGNSFVLNRTVDVKELLNAGIRIAEKRMTVQEELSNLKIENGVFVV